MIAPPLSRPSLTADLKAADFTAWPYIDTLYDYVDFLSSGAPIATFPPETQQEEVAVVGAGPGGLVAAFELLRAGLRPTVFEAGDRVGGRVWSEPFLDSGGNPPALAEMGAMRVPRSQKTFHYYAKQFGLKTGEFPDPGVVPTLLYYRSIPYRWPPGQPPPGPFQKISNDFIGFVSTLTVPVWRAWERGDLNTVRGIWQSYIDRYAKVSFFEALAAALPDWTAREFNAFGALGTGGGGFAPLYKVGFLDMLRHLVNQWEFDQVFIQSGFGGLTEGLYRTKVALPNGTQGSLESLALVKFKCPVRRIEHRNGNPVIVYSDLATGTLRHKEFSAAIVAVTTRSMEMMGITMPIRGSQPLVPSAVCDAITNLPLFNSSKMFLRTATKFWMDPGSGLPWNIQTDLLPRSIYCLDYPDSQYGVVLIDYTWGEAADKLLALLPHARLAMFKQILQVIHPGFASYLAPLHEEDVFNVDWIARPYYHGAFKANYPGQEPDLAAAYYQYLCVLDPRKDMGVYLAGDCISWSGGWTEGALQTGLNAACAVARRVGGELRPHSPLMQNPNLYHY